MPEPTPLVFVVEDDPSVREALAGLVRSVGWDVEVFLSAHEFLARPRPAAPSCLVLDVGLPGLSGLDLQLRMAELHNDVPIVFITGHGDIPMSVRAMKAGAVEFLTKPVLAAISESPFRVDQFMQNSRWNTPALSSPRVRDDAESGLLELVQRMKAPAQRFDYDVATYVVSEQYARDLYPDPYAGLGWWGYNPWWGYGRGVGAGLWLRSWDFYGHPRGWRRW